MVKARYEVIIRDRHKVVERFMFEDYWDAMRKCDILDETLESRYFTEFRDMTPFEPVNTVEKVD